MLKIILTVGALMLAGCERDPESSRRVNGEFKVKELFTHNGCTVYQFTDRVVGIRHYWDCTGSNNVEAVGEEKQ